MNTGLIARRYATALYEYSSDKDTLGNVFEDVQMIRQQFEANEGCVRFLSSPLKKTSEKVAFVETVFKGNVCETTFGFMTFVIRKGRGEVISEIFRVFEDLYKSRNGIYSVCITTAIPLSEAKISEYAEIISRKLNVKTDVSSKCDPSLIGGMVVRVGDKQLDGSIARRLKEIEKQLTA